MQHKRRISVQALHIIWVSDIVKVELIRYILKIVWTFEYCLPIASQFLAVHFIQDGEEKHLINETQGSTLKICQEVHIQNMS